MLTAWSLLPVVQRQLDRSAKIRSSNNRPIEKRHSFMFSSFIIILREGFESFLLVAVILSYLRKAGLKWLSSAVYVGIALALSASARLGYYLGQFLANESLREGILGVIAIAMVGTLVIHMWRTGPKLREKMQQRL